MKVKNAKLVGAREQLELTAKKVAEDTEIRYWKYIKYEGMKLYPKLRDQRKICKFYKDHGVPIKKKEVFPIELKIIKPRVRYYKERQVPLEDLIYLSQPAPREEIPYYPSPEEEIMKKATIEVVDEILKSLSPREEQILRMRFGIDGEELTVKQIAEHFGVTRSYINFIKKRALHRMGYPSRLKKIRGVYPP